MGVNIKHLRELSALLDRRAPGVIAKVSKDRSAENGVFVNMISVPTSQRGFGLGQRVLDIICQTADAHGWNLRLVPSSDLGSDLDRLVRWYWSAGFTPSPGGRAMRRLPRPLTAAALPRTLRVTEGMEH